ncbi:MAG: YncE family protein [Candidatus Kapaibacterium sp.]
MKYKRTDKNKRGKEIWGSFLLLTFFLIGCIPDPVVPDQGKIEGALAGVVVVNQGVWRGDNASLTFYDSEGETAFTDWFSRQNNGLRIGDTGNDIVVRGDRAYVAVSQSSVVEILALPSGESLGRVRLPAGTFPQQLLILNDSVGWVSSLDDDAVYQFNPRAMEVAGRIAVGPAPEGVAYAAGRLFVANSGLGALRATEPGAGTISVIDPESGNQLGAIEIGGNLRDLHYSPTIGNLYCFVGAALPDTANSGLVEIDPVTLRIKRRWDVSGAWEIGFDEVSGSAYVIAEGGIFRIDLLEVGIISDNNLPIPFLASSFSTLREEVPHSIAISPTGEVFIGIARGYYSAPGRVDRYSREGKFLGSFSTGLNPTAFGFVL